MNILQNGKSNIIKDLKKKINESNYLIPVENAQEKLLQHGTKNRINELLEIG
jgi:hypothetical protein